MSNNEELNLKLIGSKVKEIRRLKGETQEEFAEEIGVDVKTVGNIENGRVMPKTQTLANIARNSNTSVDDILGIK